MGACGFHGVLPDRRRAEIGFELTPDHWRQGYMREAVNTVLRFGFQTLRLHKVEALVTAPNAASRGLLTDIGLRQDGVLREQVFWKQRFHDLHVFSILEGEWTEASRAP